jgi:hypothetical protein
MKRITIILIVLLIVIAIYYYKPSNEQKPIIANEHDEQNDISEIAMDQQCSTDCCGLSSYSCGNGDGGTGCPCVNQKTNEYLSSGRSVATSSLEPYNSSTYDEYF